MKKLSLLWFLFGLLSVSLAKAEDESEIRSLDYIFSSVNEYPDVVLQTSSSSVTIMDAPYYNYSMVYMELGDKIDAIIESDCNFIMVLNMKDMVSRIGSLTHPYNIYDNGILVETCPEGMAGYDYYFQKSIDFSAGKHTITIETPDGGGYFAINFIKDVEVVASLSEPGSLGTEILYSGVERIQDVRKLKVIGDMNDDDWNKIMMMNKSLVELDLSQANTPYVPKEAFKNNFYDNFNDWNPLRKVILPEGLTSIGEYAFYNSFIEHINFPTTLETINDWAFRNSSIKEALMSDKTINLGYQVFEDCKGLEMVSLSKDLKIIPESSFRGCTSLKNFDMPQNLIEIGNYAFFDCKYINFDIPSSVSKLGEFAFYNTNNDPDNIKETLVWPENCTSGFYDRAFCNTNYKYVIFPVGFNMCEMEVVSGDVVQTIRLCAPTVVKGGEYWRIIGEDYKSNITIEVPDFLVNSYKLDDYWYDCKEIVGFDASEISHWIIKDNLIFSSHDRLTNTPSITIELNGSLKINGTEKMPLNELCVYGDPENDKFGQIFSNADGVTVKGDLWSRMHLNAINKWYFLSLPYDLKVSEIQSITGSPQWAIRYYDGANRAENGAFGSWKDFEEDAVIPAGTGFIININQEAWLKLPSQENQTKQFGTSVNMFSKTLEEYPTDVAADQGWNLVGNPYFCYYNIHKLNFTAPITVRKNDNYLAYSIIDDDYALRPFEAFFVQCPTSNNVIEFPLSGRQITSEVISQQGAPALQPQDLERKIITISACGDSDPDITRIVFNEDASLAYELECDASKFIGDNAEIPQIYSIDSDGIRYAINERPELEGTVNLGFLSKHNGSYTIKADLCQFANAYLYDSYTGITTNLVNNSYTFDCEQGEFNDRFSLNLEASTSGLIQNELNGKCRITNNHQGISLTNCFGDVQVYNLSGVKVADVHCQGDVSISLSRGTYIVRTQQGTFNVAVL